MGFHLIILFEFIITQAAACAFLIIFYLLGDRVQLFILKLWYPLWLIPDDIWTNMFNGHEKQTCLRAAFQSVSSIAIIWKKVQYFMTTVVALKHITYEQILSLHILPVICTHLLDGILYRFVFVCRCVKCKISRSQWSYLYYLKCSIKLTDVQIHVLVCTSVIFNQAFQRAAVGLPVKRHSNDTLCFLWETKFWRADTCVGTHTQAGTGGYRQWQSRPETLQEYSPVPIAKLWPLSLWKLAFLQRLCLQVHVCNGVTRKKKLL